MKHLLIIGLLAFTACSFNGQDETTKQYLEDREDLLQKYSSVTGTYEGGLAIRFKSKENPGQLESKEIPLQIAIYTEDLPMGRDNNGETKLVPVLRIRYRQLDAVRSDVVLEGRYISETGELNGASSDGITTLRNSFLKNGSLSGEVYRGNGKLGSFHLALKSREVLSLTGDAESDLFERTAEKYRSISGIYKGTVTPPAELGSAYPVQVELNYVPISRDSKVVATLKGTYRRLDHSDPSISQRFMDVTFRLDVTPAELVMSSEGGGTATIPNAYFLSIVGALEEDTISGVVHDRRGYQGTVTLTRE